ncbi:MAG: hypothetical protein H7144_05210, partial [Burkholderiales bacterium]|nr:hypothetical protein [Phycisphaerae bacterium]
LKGIIYGIILTFIYVIFCLKMSVGVASVYVAVSLAVNMLMISLGCLLAMKMLDFSLGAPALALIKICAVAMLPGVISNFIEFYSGMMGAFVGWAVALLLYYALLMWFFDLDGMEVMIVTSIIWLVRTWLGFAVVAIVLSAILGGGNFAGTGPIAQAIGGGGGARSIKTDDSPPGRTNQRAEVLLMRRGRAEAREWIAGGADRIVLNFDHAGSVKAIEDLYEAGAEEVTATDINKAGAFMMADKLVVELPEEPEDRARVFAVHAAAFEKRDTTGAKELGPDQAYMILDFDGNDDPLR